MNSIQQGPTPDASATVRGLMTPADKAALDAAVLDVAALQLDVAALEAGVAVLEASSHAAVTLGAVGSSPNANGASLAGQVLSLQPADGSSPGVVTAAAQTFGGAKTFAAPVTVASQGGSQGAALSLGAMLDELRFPTSNGDAALTGWVTAAEPTLYSRNAPFRTQSATGFFIGGVLIQFSTAGVTASAGSAVADLINTQTGQKTSIVNGKGAAAGVVTKIGTSQGTPHADAELLRVGYGMANSYGSDGTAMFNVWGNGRIGVSGSAAGTALGSVVKKLPIYDVAGSLLGYLPIYDSIT